MRAYAICGAVAIKRKPRTTDSNHGLPIAPNLLERNFTASAPNTAWIAVASKSRSGDCLENAAIESFWHTLKTELVFRTHYETKEDARRDPFAFIEGFSIPHRLHSTLGYISPAEAERRTA